MKNKNIPEKKRQNKGKKKTISAEAGLQAFQSLRSLAKENGVQGMTLRAINREIAASRKRK